MFKKIKENDYIQKFIELWNIPRYRSLLILLIYIIFFFFVISFIRTENNSISPKQNQVSPIEKYKDMNNYGYRATIKNETNKTIIGRVNQEKQLIMFDNNDYYFNGSKLYKKEDIYIETKEQLLEFDIWTLTPSLIYNLINEGSLASKTEYSDGSISQNYVVTVGDFVKYFYGDDLIDNNNISITLYENSENIKKVELDLTNVYRMQQFSNSYDYKVTLEYELINEIGPIIVNVESSD